MPAKTVLPSWPAARQTMSASPANTSTDQAAPVQASARPTPRRRVDRYTVGTTLLIGTFASSKAIRHDVQDQLGAAVVRQWTRFGIRHCLRVDRA